MTNIRRRLLVVFSALCVAAGGLAVSAGPAQAVSTSGYPCVVAHYPDGRSMFSACNQFVNPVVGSGTWTSAQRKIWNPPLNANGHSDIIFDWCMFGSWQTSVDCTPTAFEDETRYSNPDYTLSDSATLWGCVRVQFGEETFNRQVSFNSVGQVSVVVSATCGPDH